jgi:hypothetical protein
MNRATSILKSIAFSISVLAVWFAALQAQAADSGGKADEGSMDYMLSYLIVILGIALGILVVAKSSMRRERERPTGYVEKKIIDDE